MKMGTKSPGFAGICNSGQQTCTVRYLIALSTSCRSQSMAHAPRHLIPPKDDSQFNYETNYRKKTCYREISSYLKHYKFGYEDITYNKTTGEEIVTDLPSTPSRLSSQYHATLQSQKKSPLCRLSTIDRQQDMEISTPSVQWFN